MTDPAAHTHGRNCRCTPCRAEDWDAIEAGIRAAHTPDVDTLVAEIGEAFHAVRLAALSLPLRKQLDGADVALRDLAATARENVELRRKLWADRGGWLDTQHRAEAAEADRDRLARRVAELEAALRSALDCKGPYNGTVSERGGGSALCVKCVESIQSALLGDGGES